MNWDRSSIHSFNSFDLNKKVALVVLYQIYLIFLNFLCFKWNWYLKSWKNDPKKNRANKKHFVYFMLIVGLFYWDFCLFLIASSYVCFPCFAKNVGTRGFSFASQRNINVPICSACPIYPHVLLVKPNVWHALFA